MKIITEHQPAVVATKNNGLHTRTVPAIRLPVLMYHAVAPVSGRFHRLGVPLALFEEQMAALTETGYELVNLTRGVALAAEGRRDVVALTFDDGYADFLYSVLPVVQRLGAGATLYVPTAHIGGYAAWLPKDHATLPRLLTTAELKACADCGGVEIGSHGHTHRPLDELPASELEDEIVGSRNRLEHALERPVLSFCYPHGYHSPAVRATVRAAGYDNACEVGRRLRTAAHRWSISRLAVGPGTRPERLLAEVGSGGPLIVPGVKRVLQPLWRQARRARTTLS